MKFYRNLGKRHWKMMALFVVLGCSSAFLSAWSTSLLQNILDRFTARTLSFPLILIYGSVLIGLCLINYAQNLPESKLSNGLYLDFKLEALRKMETIDYRQYAALGTGMLVQRIESGARAGRNIVFGFWMQLFSALLPEMLSSLLFIALIDKTVVLWLLVGYAAAFIVSNLLLKLLYRIKNRILIDEETLSGRLVRGLMEMVVFRVNRRYDVELSAVMASRNRIVSDKTRMQLVHELFFTLFAILVAVIKLGFLLYAYSVGQLTAGEFVALTALVDKAYQPIAVFNVLFVQYKLDKMALRRYNEVLAAPDHPRMLSGLSARIDCGEVKLCGVSCAYGNQAVLHRLSLCLPGGSVVGLAGESGSGKSTMVRLLLGFLTCGQGEILIDGQRLSELYLPDYYRCLSYTPQEPPIFDGTIRENIVFDRDVADKEILRALESVHLSEYVRKQPQGLDTPVGEKGVRLSGGERQRLALARLFFQSGARLFILDEATSALDSITEKAVMRALLEALHGRTVLMIAHHLSILRQTDQIFLLRGGVLQGSGTYDQLSSENPYFMQLLRASSRSSI